MADPAATLRALADACGECDRISKSDDHEWAANQRHVIVNALPDVTGWTATAAELRTMADTVDRLTRERDEARALLATPKPRRDPLTDPRPGDVVRWDGMTCRITGRGPEVVTYVSLSSGTEWFLSIGPWRDWTGFDVEVLHTADEVTP